MNPHMVSLQSLADGTAQVTASSGDLSEAIEVVVKRRIARFRLMWNGVSDAPVIMHLADILQLVPVLNDSLGHQMPVPATVTYSSADTTIVVVNMNGHVMGAGVGKTAVTGRLVLPESTLVDDWPVTVWPRPPQH
jgi:hypothetical protein